MPRRRLWIYTLMFLLAAINYIDRSALSVAAAPLAKEFSLDLSMNSVLTQYAAQAGPTALVNLLDALLLHNTMTQDMQQAIVQAVSGDDPSTMTKNVAYLIVTSPQFRVIQ